MNLHFLYQLGRTLTHYSNYFSYTNDIIHNCNKCYPYLIPLATSLREIIVRVLHVMGSLDFGGIERLVSDLAVSQKKNGLNVSLLVDKKGGAYQKKIIENDIPLFISLIEGGYDFSYENINI